MNSTNEAFKLMHIMPFDFLMPETAFQRNNEKYAFKMVRKVNYKFTRPIVWRHKHILLKLVNHNPMKVKRYNSFMSLYLVWKASPSGHASFHKSSTLLNNMPFVWDGPPFNLQHPSSHTGRGIPRFMSKSLVKF